jgi:hypothetical protein
VSKDVSTIQRLDALLDQTEVAILLKREISNQLMLKRTLRNTYPCESLGVHVGRFVNLLGVVSRKGGGELAVTGQTAFERTLNDG